MCVRTLLSTPTPMDAAVPTGEGPPGDMAFPTKEGVPGEGPQGDMAATNSLTKATSAATACAAVVPVLAAAVVLLVVVVVVVVVVRVAVFVVCESPVSHVCMRSRAS